MAEEIKETVKPIELTEVEKQAIQQQRMINANIIACKTEIDAVLQKHNCYITINGGLQVAGNIASSQLRVDILMR